ncbi:MAG: gamma-glutamylcyclotransferase family protein [Synechococcaceae cyanobacterium ELA445]|jgi:gamma-glutamylcyclotransferase (GGCT)/AIG2-like uncharacterized protein YtfP
MDAVFVYGTLKRGQGNHHWLRGAPCRGRRRLLGARLHDLGPYPMAVPGDGVIHGEIYAISADDLERLDELEDAPLLYQRHQRPLDDGSLAWVYLGRPEQVRHCRLVPFSDWGTAPVFLPGPSPHQIAGLPARCCAAGRHGLLHHLAPPDRKALQPLTIVSVGLEAAPGILFEALTPRAPYH